MLYVNYISFKMGKIEMPSPHQANKTFPLKKKPSMNQLNNSLQIGENQYDKKIPRIKRGHAII